MRPAVTGVPVRQAATVVMGKSSARVSARSCTMDCSGPRLPVSSLSFYQNGSCPSNHRLPDTPT